MYRADTILDAQRDSDYLNCQNDQQMTQKISNALLWFVCPFGTAAKRVLKEVSS